MASPVISTLANVVGLELHVTPVNGCMVPSVKVPVATNCSSLLMRTEGFCGETAIDTSWAAPIVADVEPEMVPDIAETMTEPCFTPVKRPLALIVATVESDVAQLTDERAFVEPSE